jgi:hypothetical protein
MAVLVTTGRNGAVGHGQILGVDPWIANQHFLNGRIAAGDEVLSVVPRGKVRLGTYLSKEIAYLRNHGYDWIDDLTLRKVG